MFSWLTAILLFLVYIVVEVIYTYHTIWTARLRPIGAAITSGILYGTVAFGTINYIDQPWYILPILLGASIGTYLATLREKTKRNKRKRKRRKKYGLNRKADNTNQAA